MERESHTPDREQSSGAPPRILRLRANDVLLAVPLAIVVSLFSYVRSIDRSQSSGLAESAKVIKADLRDYADQRFNLLDRSFADLREYSKETNKRQDEQLEYLRKLMIQVTK